MLTPSRKLLEKKYELMTTLYLRMVALNNEAFFPPGTKMGDYCELLIIVKTIINRQVTHRSTTLSALSRAIEISRTTLYRRLLRLKTLGVVEEHDMSYVLAPGSMDTPGAIRNVERLATAVEDTAKKLSNLERSSVH